jgi:hypothetical protein
MLLKKSRMETEVQLLLSKPISTPIVAAVCFRQSETSYLGSYDGSIGLAAQEGRDIENVFLDRIAHSR